MWRAIHCTNCEERIYGDPVRFDGEPYCCHGCVAGGPCICTPQRRRAAAALTRGNENAGMREPGMPEPIRLSAPGTRSVVLRVRPFVDQPQLLRFAHALEHDPEVAEVALVHSEPHDAWFSLRAPSADSVIDALGRLEEFEVTATASGTAVEARIVRPNGQDGDRDIDRGGDGDGDGALLPPRRRYRLFRPTANGERPAGERASATTEPAERWIEMPLRLIRQAAPHDGRRRDREIDEPQGSATHYTLVCSPFRSFATLNEFQGAVRDLPGVRAAWLRQLEGGALHLAVDYADRHTAFPRRLDEIEGFEWRLVSESANQVQIELLGRSSEVHEARG